MNTKTLITAALAATLITTTASACDLCGCILPNSHLARHSGWYAGASEQYTRFGTLRENGHTIGDSANQFLRSSSTQVYLGHDFPGDFGLQINVPIIYRSFRRVQGDAVETGNVSGFGDVTLLATWSPLHFERGGVIVTGRVLAGIKLPTGDSDRILEESAEGGEGEGGGEGGELPRSGVHGHDLALGTGSVDGIFGADVHVAWKRAFIEAGVQVAVRGKGRDEYRFADDLLWRAALGVLVVDRKDFNLAIAAQFSGETKGEDESRGVRGTDTASTVISVGPRIIATWRERVSVDFGIEFPIVRENSGVQSVQDLRIQSGVNIRF